MRIEKRSKFNLKGINGIVIPVFKNRSFERIIKKYPEAEFFIKEHKFKGKIGEEIIFNSVKHKMLIIVAGAGEYRSLIDARKITKNIIMILKENRIKNILIQFIQNIELSLDHLVNFIDYLYINNYFFDLYKKDHNESKKLNNINIFFEFKNDLTNNIIENRSIIDKSVRLVRDLVNEIPSKVNPDYMKDLFKQVSDKNNLEISIMREKELDQKGFNGLVSVGKGSPYEPALIQLNYIPEKYKKSVAIVGKGITFDSGGLNIKTGNSMLEMKADMAGAAAVLGILKSVSDLKLPVKVYGYAAIAENMPGRKAYKPGDIITYRNKKTVEVINTDAEGRLVIADALISAAEEKPDYIIELSTLTGAIIVALGDSFAGLISNNKKLITNLVKSGERTGEYLWEMPMFEDYRESIKSKIADLKNANYRGASSIKAGLFLNEFTANIPFAHIDIAGTAFLSKQNKFYSSEGATGFGVRLIYDFLNFLK